MNFYRLITIPFGMTSHRSVLDIVVLARLLCPLHTVHHSTYVLEVNFNKLVRVLGLISVFSIKEMSGLGGSASRNRSHDVLGEDHQDLTHPSVEIGNRTNDRRQCVSIRCGSDIMPRQKHASSPATDTTRLSETHTASSLLLWLLRL